VIKLNSVVLPAPFGPMTALRSPGMTRSETSRVAWRPPKLLHNCLSSSAGISPDVCVSVLTRKSSKRYNEMPGLISWAPAPACLFAVFAGRERPAVNRLLEELVLPIGPELADVRIGLDDGVPKLGLGITEHLLFLDLLDVDVLDRVAL